MNITNSVVRAICGLALIVPLSAQSGNQEFYRAYYLEQEERDLQAALDLYRQIADTGDSKSLRQRAKGRARSVAEELACTDFARLMPASAAFYVEVNSPGAQLRRLTEQLGLMRAARDGGIGLSPELIDGVLGMRGAAIAITEFDPRRGPTNGVLLFHPGDMKILRGVLETALPIGGREVDRIGGYPTYDIEGQALVTLTDRLAIASRDRGEIEAVVARLVGDGGPSLADAPGVERAMELRGDDLLFFCVNLEQMMPMIQNAIARETRRNRELQMALSFVDLESTKTIAGRIGVDDDGISLEVGIDLDEDHRNLAFNLLRLPGIDRDTLAMVPAGAAFFAASAITGSGSVPPTLKDARGEPIVTWMDFGREFYANIADVAFFTMPTVSRGPFGPMPDMALAMRVNDVERSRSLWQFVFQTAQAATNKGTEGEGRNLGEGVERYEIAGVPVFLATHDDQLLITPSAAAIEATVAARKGNKSILDDDVFARALANMSDGGTVAAAVNMGRCAEIATHFMNDRERREMMPIAQIVEDTSIAVTLQQTSHRAGINAQLSGIPNVREVVEQLIERELGGRQRRSIRRSAAVRAAPANLPAERTDLEQAFAERHAAGDIDEARAIARKLATSGGREAGALNSFAWALLTDATYGNQYDDVALVISKASNEGSGWTNWYHLDTYANALFRLGKIDEAVAMERRAIALGADDPRIKEAENTLERFLATSKRRKIQQAPND